MNFLFFWRLSREKGFDLIVEALSRLVRRPDGLPGNFCIFGEGDLKKRLFETFADHPSFHDCSGWDAERINTLRLTPNPSSSSADLRPLEEKGDSNKIFFFGWQSKATIESVLRVSHFSLMPSRFLETFGLVALESLAEGVPVVGFRKWGLVPFIPEELALAFSVNDEENIEALANKILEVSGKYSEEPSSSPILLLEGEGWGEWDNWKSLSNASRRIADSYTEERWIRQVRDMLPKHTKKILLATDYITLLGGIETHVQTIAHALRRHGYEVEVFGWSLPKGKWTKILRLAGLVYSLCNITFALKIRKKIREYGPDVVWLHSVSRFLGPLTVREVVKWSRERKTLVTYHDLGLWSPFPSRVESEGMVPKNPSLGAFLGVIDSKNPIAYLAAYCKYFQIFILRKLLKNIDIHIVPSAFLVRYIRNISEIPEDRVVVLEHFL